MLAVGLTLTESGFIFVLIPIVGCIGSPLAGILADKLGDYKKVVILLILLAGASHAALGFAVPVYSVRNVTTSLNTSEVLVTFPCRNTSFQEENKYNASQYGFLRSNTTKPTIILSGCEYLCATEKSVPELCFLSSRNSGCVRWENPNNSSLNELFSNLNPETTSSVSFTGKSSCDNVDFCQMKCRGQLSEQINFNHTEKIVSGDRLITFALYTLFRVIGAMAVSSVMQLIDASTLLMSRQHHGDFGIQRTFGLFGSLLMPPLTGYLIEVASKATGRQDYSPAFYLFCSMFTLGAILTWLMDLEIKPPAKQIWTTVGKLLKNVKVFSFVLVMFLVGCCFGALEKYVF